MSKWRIPRLENLWPCVVFRNVDPNGWSALFGPSWRGVIWLELGRANLFDTFSIDSNFWDTFPWLERLSLPQEGTLSLANGPPNAHPLRPLAFGPFNHYNSPFERRRKMQTWLAGCPGVSSIKVKPSLEEVVWLIQRKLLEDVLLNEIRFVDGEGVALTKDLLDTLALPPN